MNGRGKAAERKIEEITITSWLIGARTAEGVSGSLKALQNYLPRKSVKQTPEDMLAAFRAMQAGGAPISIKQIN